jgi:hypothetical protein
MKAARVFHALAAALAVAAGLAPGSAAAWPEKIRLPVDGPATNAPAPAAGEVPELWFPVGEEQLLDLQWGIISVGTSRVWTEWIREYGEWLLVIRMRTKTTRVLDAIYPVDDYIESVVDPKTFLPRRFVKKINEGKSRYDELTVFEHARGIATWRSLRDGKAKVFPIEADTRDIPAMLYWFRKERFEPGDPRQFQVMADEKMYTVFPKPVARETLRTPQFGQVPCMRFEPEAQFNGLFVRKGRLWVWVAEDDRRLAVRLVAEVPVANVKAVLVGVRGPGNDRWVGRGVPADLSKPVPR